MELQSSSGSKPKKLLKILNFKGKNCLRWDKFEEEKNKIEEEKNILN